MRQFWGPKVSQTSSVLEKKVTQKAITYNSTIISFGWHYVQRDNLRAKLVSSQVDGHAAPFAALMGGSATTV